MIQRLEDTLKLRLPNELRYLYEIAQNNKFDELKLDIRGVNKHWFLNYEYSLLLPVDSCEMEYFAKVNSEVNYYQYLWGWIERKTLVFAETQKIVDGGGFLFYAFDVHDNNLGLYSSAMGWIEEVVEVAGSLSDLFEIPLNKNVIEQHNLTNTLKLSPKKRTYFLDYKEVVSNESYMSVDAEFGFLMNLHMYKDFIDKTLIPLTKDKLGYDQLLNQSNDPGVLKLNWLFNGKSWEVELDSTTDYLDLKIFPFLNLILADLNVEERFIPFHEEGQGQDFTFGFFNKQEQENIRNVSNIRLWEY
jgi:hypothetical protein